MSENSSDHKQALDISCMNWENYYLFSSWYHWCHCFWKRQIIYIIVSITCINFLCNKYIPLFQERHPLFSLYKMIVKIMQFISVLGPFQDEKVIVLEIRVIFRKRSKEECSIYVSYRRICSIMWCLSVSEAVSTEIHGQLHQHPVPETIKNHDETIAFQLATKCAVSPLTANAQDSIFIAGNISCSIMSF